MKLFIRKNLTSIILAAIIVVMIPVIIILPNKLNKSYELEGIYKHSVATSFQNVYFTAVIEKQTDGNYKVTYTEENKFSDIEDVEEYEWEFIVPGDYKFGTEINSDSSYMYVLDLYPGYLFIAKYYESGHEIFKQVLEKENYTEYRPIAEMAIRSVFLLVCIAFIISVVIKYKYYVGIVVTAVLTFLAVFISSREGTGNDYNGHYMLNEFPKDVWQTTYYSYCDIYLKKIDKNTYRMLTKAVGSPIAGGLFVDSFEPKFWETEVQVRDGKVVIDSENVSNVGLLIQEDVYFEKQGDKFVIYADEDSILYEYTQEYGRKEYKELYYIVRGLGVLILLAVTIKMYVRDRNNREKPDIFKPYYGVYNVGDVICAGDGYSDLVSYVSKGVVGGIMIVAKKSFEMNDKIYDKVNYELHKNIELPEGMLPEFNEAKIMSVDVEDNRYYLVHKENQDAVITTLGNKMLIAYRILKNKEDETKDVSG